ncbi:Lrp/AsnC family transcriptional regulator [Brevundimonas terrae]|uniref:Lrp/AsnC family transcriptional regulator n=1 Tax=Brevundimonas terrae TaxID=363631 RepID=A0ABN0Y780_9CAUL|nr:Lrp/AsnC family transcriptional regulator [Brevundimonas terrae]NIJ25388.1 Lrp/AsnC family transcriptional regulator for asnA, asnC and gidA [Brevundimonas terrae]
MQIRESNDGAVPTLDELETGIIDILRENGRATNLEIAERLGVTAATVSSRIKRLEESRAMKVVAVSDFAAHGFEILLAVGVKVTGRDVDAVATELAALPEVFSINMVTGRFDMELLVALRSFDEIAVLLTEHVGNIQGISDLDAGVVYDVVKFEFNVAPL